MTELDALIRNVVRHSTFFCAVILQNISSTPKSRRKENLRSSRQPDKESHSRGGPARHRVFTIHAASSPLFCTSRTGSNCCPLTDRPPAACDPLLTPLVVVVVSLGPTKTPWTGTKETVEPVRCRSEPAAPNAPPREPKESIRFATAPAGSIFVCVYTTRRRGADVHGRPPSRVKAFGTPKTSEELSPADPPS